jgi:hypothetical protein
MKNNSNGIGFMGALTLLFVALKLLGYINWSWWLVLLPVYGPLILALILLAIMVAVGVFK